MLTKLKQLLFNSLPIILLGLVLLGPHSFAQTESPKTETTHADIQEEHDTKNLDKLLKDYSRDQEKVLKDAENIPKAEETSDIPANVSAKTKIFDSSIFKRNQDPKDLKKIKYSQAMKIALEPLQRMSEKELIKLLYENTSGSAARVYVERYPKLAVFAVRLIKSEDALPGLAKIADDEDRFIRFLGIMLSTILISFSLKRLMKREGRTVLKAVSLWFLRFVIISSLRLAVLLYFFSEEVSPIFKIDFKTFF